MGALDYISGREIVGGDMQEIIGAATAAAINQLAAVRSANGVAVIERDGSKKIKPLPFSQALAVAAAGVATVSCTAPELYRPGRLIIGGAVSWVVTNQEITTKNQMAASGSLPGEMFAFNAWGVQVEFDTIPVGGSATMTAQNVSAGAASLVSSFIGISIG